MGAMGAMTGPEVRPRSAQTVLTALTAGCETLVDLFSCGLLNQMNQNKFSVVHELLPQRLTQSSHRPSFAFDLQIRVALPADVARNVRGPHWRVDLYANTVAYERR